MWDDAVGVGMPSIFLGQHAFVDAGHRVRFLYPGRDNRKYEYQGVELHQFRFRWPVASPRHRWLHRITAKIYTWAFLPAAFTAAYRSARDMRPDVIYGHFYPAAPVAWLLARLLRMPNVTRMYGTFLHAWLSPWWKRILKFEEALAFRIPCAYLIMTNDGTRGDDCAHALGTPAHRFKFWRNGIDKSVYQPDVDVDAFKRALEIPATDRIVMSITRLVEWKGVHRLIAALPAVLDQFPGVTAIIVGDGDERRRLESMARDLGVASKVRFVGAIPHSQTPEYMNAADVFVSLYRVSNVGNPLLEALCCGRCIVTLSNGATPKLIEHGVTGILVDEGRLDELPRALIDVLRDGEKRRRLAAAARRYAVEHLQTWPERTAMEIRLIEDLVREQGRRLGR